MIFTSDSLPLSTTNVDQNGRRVGFVVNQSQSFWSRARERLNEIINYAIHAPTGSLSDGLGGDSESSTSTSVFIAAQKMVSAEKAGDDWEVDEVVVSGDDQEYPQKLGMVGSEHSTSGSPRLSTHDDDSLRRDSDNILQHHSPGLTSILWSNWMLVVNFFDPKFDDEDSELDFRKHRWYSTKTWAFYSTMLLITNWFLYLILNLPSTKHTIYAQVLFYGGLTLLTVPLPILIAMDVPFHYPIPFQLWFAAAVWYCGITETLQTYICHFFDGENTCFGKDFLAMMFYNTALPALMMFVVSDRLYNAILQVAEFVLLMVLVIPVQAVYARNVVSFVLFSIFLQGLHYNREMTERRLYLLNTQLKVAYKSQQKAQMAHARASHAKRRFASYIFHEVRVPLNNAAIAFNNMTTNDAFRQALSDDTELGEDVEALDVSLATVQQVLNDSLDLEKMDAGHFDINPRPFPLHRVIRSTLGPLIVTATAKNFAFHVNLDEHIDHPHPEVVGNLHGSTNTSNGNNSAYSPSSPSDLFGSTSSSPSRGRGEGGLSMLNAGSVVKGHETWVMGDEVRLRQVLTNLASNAVKFTPEGTSAGVTVNTVMVSRRKKSGGGSTSAVGNADAGMGRDLEKGGVEVKGGVEGGRKRQARVHLDSDHGDTETHQSREYLVFRLEIIDGGPGIKPSDLTDNQLFQPFAQTKIGRLSKNSTGLGLAIVRQIVSLSGGKFGVQSQKGRGATFWVELAYPIAEEADVRTFLTSSSVPYSPPSFFAAQTPAALAAKGISLSTVASAEDMESSLNTKNMVATTVMTTAPPLPSPSAPSLLSPSFDRQDSDVPLIRKYSSSRNTKDDGVVESSEAKKVVVVKPDPLVIETQAQTSTQATPVTAEDDAPLVVLIVDDNTITRETMSRSLRKRGCIVDTARDGKECLDMVLGPNAKMYDLISLDNDMPVMTGEEAVKEIREVGREDIFVVGCTGNALTEDQTRYLDAGANRVLVKPLRFELLTDILETARQKRQERLKKDKPNS